ncbi:MAG: hypothetical protein VB031_09495 [Eubacteriaceae bacterium]|nr:hypothetical protein [Eubacteriaceae bacterium]
MDWRGNKNIIIDDEEEFGGGLQVMCNYAWTYQYVLEQVRDWDVDQNDAEYLYAVKKILRAG